MERLTHRQRRGYGWILFCACLGATGFAQAETLHCPDSGVTITAADGQMVEGMCQRTGIAIESLAQCNIEIEGPVQIDLVEEIAKDCYGLYHCDDRRIELLLPDRLGQVRPENSAFRDIPVDAFFDSLLVHELSHMAYDDAPCPFEQCRATAEYIAYTMQVRSLAPNHRAAFESGISAPDAPVSAEAISVILLAMAPDVFAARAWTHFTQRPDGCDYIRLLMQGDLWFDHEMF